MREQMSLVFKLLRKACGKPNRKSAIWGAQRAWAKIQERHRPGAVYFAQSATAFDPTWSEGYRMLRLAYRGQDRFDEARAALQEALGAGIGDLRLLLDFGDLERSAGDVAAAVGDIASSSHEMATGARSVTEAMQSISVVVEECSAATEEMAAQASAVAGAIVSIAAVSEQQSAATEEVSASTEQMSAQVEQMSAQAQALAETAAQLKGLVSRFQLDDDDHTATVPEAVASGPRQPAAGVTPLRRVA